MKNLKNKSIFFTSVSEISNLYYKNKFQKYINEKFNILDFGCGTGELIEKFNVKKNWYRNKPLLNFNT